MLKYFLSATIFCFLIHCIAHAQIPKTLSYQGVLTNTTGIPLPDSTYSITFRLYVAATGGFPAWSETRSVQTAKGLFNVILGEVNPLNLAFTQQYWLAMIIPPNPELSPRIKLASSPYTFHSIKADTASYAQSAAALVDMPLRDTMSVAGTGFSLTHTDHGQLMELRLTNASSANNSLSISHAGQATAVQITRTGAGFGSGLGVFNTNAGSGDVISTSNNGTGSTIFGSATGTGRAAFFQISNSGSSANTVQAEGNSVGSSLSGLMTGNGRAGRFEVNNSTNAGAGLLSVHNGTSASEAITALHTGAGRAGQFEITNTTNSSTSFYAATNGTGRAGHFAITNSANGSATLYSSTLGLGSAAYFETVNASNTAPALQVSTLGGTGRAAFFNGEVEVNVLEILGGSDLAEPFETTEETEIEPGTIMVIDADNPGKLTQSTKAYDQKVAGIVSGAEGVRPGIRLRQEGVMEGNTTVAIAGRVYCKADASITSIEPGDLLTTSSLLGHAMKATDRDAANGAIIGKAMTGLKSGNGFVLVLVNLQ